MKERKNSARVFGRKSNKRINNKPIVNELIKTMSEVAHEPDSTDIDGSWTGVPYDNFDIPVQDADDL